MHDVEPAFGWYEPSSHCVAAIAPLVETKLPAGATVHGPRPVALNPPAAHRVGYPVKVDDFESEVAKTMSNVVDSPIESTANSRSVLAPFTSSVDTAAPIFVFTVANPVAEPNVDSMYSMRRVSRFLSASRDSHSKRNESRERPVID